MTVLGFGTSTLSSEKDKQTTGGGISLTENFHNQVFWSLFPMQGTGALRGQGHTGQFCSLLVSRERGWHGDQPLSGSVSGQTGASIPVALSSHAHVPEIQRERLVASHFTRHTKIRDIYATFPTLFHLVSLGSETKLKEIKTEPSSMFFGTPFGTPQNGPGLVSIAITLKPAAAEVRKHGDQRKEDGKEKKKKKDRSCV